MRTRMPQTRTMTTTDDFVSNVAFAAVATVVAATAAVVVGNVGDDAVAAVVDFYWTFEAYDVCLN